jgi:imidazolonepropionase-like amidohydrolase
MPRRGRFPVLVAILATVCAAAGAAILRRAPVKATVITDVTLLDGRGGPPQRADVIVENGRIASVHLVHDQGVIRAFGVSAGSNATLLDGSDRFLVPGFIDMHAHLLAPRCTAGPDGTVFDRAVSEQMLSTLLDFGITTVRSPSTPTRAGLALRDDLNAGRVRGPRAMASAELINDPTLTDAQLRQVVRDALPFRPDYVKVYARLPPASVATVIDEAHAHGVPVIGHLGETSWRQGAELGIDYLTHAADWSVETLPEDQRAGYREAVRTRGPVRARIDWLERLDVHAAPVQEMIAAIARHGISIDPTLVAFDTKFAAPNGGAYRHDPFANVVPALLSDWNTCTTITADWMPEDYRRWRAAYPKLQALVRALRDGGVLLTTGTDLTNPWVIPGESLHQEFELLVAAGFSPGDVLRMTGADAARALKRSDVGVIEAGRLADLVLLDQNPLENIANTRAIRWVMKEGVVVKTR